MASPFDFKKEDKQFYAPKTEPGIIEVPEMLFIQVDGSGNPNDPGGEYAAAISLLYSLSYTIKMNKKGPMVPAGFFEYVVPPLEGLWWYKDESTYDVSKKDQLCWTAMIRQPEFVTLELFAWAQTQVGQKKPDLDPAKARLVRWTEGLCVQVMHLGPYDDEPQTVARMDAFIRQQGRSEDLSGVQPDGKKRRHHEIYLTDPSKTDPAKMKTVLRHPIR